MEWIFICPNKEIDIIILLIINPIASNHSRHTNYDYTARTHVSSHRTNRASDMSHQQPENTDCVSDKCSQTTSQDSAVAVILEEGFAASDTHKDPDFVSKRLCFGTREASLRTSLIQRLDVDGTPGTNATTAQDPGNQRKEVPQSVSTVSAYW